MRAEIDFVVAGTALVVGALWDVDAQDRDQVARRGIAELETVGARADLARPALDKLARGLTEAGDIHAAEPSRAEDARAALQLPRIPRELGADTRERLLVLGGGARTIGDVYEAGDWLLALTADGERVAPVRVATDGALVTEPLRW